MFQIPLGNFRGIGTLGNPGNSPVDAFQKFTQVISTVIAVLTVSGGLWFIVQIFIGALNWLSAGSDKQAVENARKRIINALVGLIVVIFAFGIISLVGYIFGFNILSPARIFNVVPSNDGSPDPDCIPGIPCGI